MLQSAREHYAAQQRITAAGLIELRRRRFGPLDRLVQGMVAYQALAATETGQSFAAMLAEQNLDVPVEAEPVTAGLVGAASDGRDLTGLLDFSRSDQVTATAFDLIVATQLQDVSRNMAAICFGTRPSLEGYTRILTAPSCSRCAVLAGKFFKRSVGFQRHPRCDCRHVPTAQANAGDLTTDPRGYFDSLATAQQDATFTKAGAEAIRRGADIGQVVNARAGMSTAQQVLRGPGDRWTASGRLITVKSFGQQVFTTTEGMTKRGVAFQARGRQYVRLMPESILEIADSDAEVLRLLKANGYIT